MVNPFSKEFILLIEETVKFIFKQLLSKKINYKLM